MTDKLDRLEAQCKSVFGSARTDDSLIGELRLVGAVPALIAALREAIEALEKNAKPALGGKLQQWNAQAALDCIHAHLERLPV